MLSPALLRSESVFDELRQREFARLDATDHSYLDYTGSALYGQSQLDAHFELLRSGLFGNPHSDSAPSRASTAWIESAREIVLRYFGVDSSTHVVCFTANTTAAVKLVAESYPFDPDCDLVLTADNHNSINGIREYARRAGTSLRTIPLQTSPGGEMRLQNAASILAAGSGRGLFAFPAQSNFSGVHHPLMLVAEAKRRGYDVLLDAAAFVPSNPLCLRECAADFTVLSFYKMFGYPTGIGALIARRSAIARLRRPWFAGGTVLYASVGADVHRLREGAEGFEDGTPDFLSIASLAAGFDLLREAGIREIQRHVHALTGKLLNGLSELRHSNGSPLVRLYGPSSMTQRGGTVALNVLDRRGAVIACEKIEATAREANVSVRSGCFCNPGASEAAFEMDPQGTRRSLELLGRNFTAAAYRDTSTRPVGAIRVSAGMANNSRDIDRFLEVIASTRPVGAIRVSAGMANNSRDIDRFLEVIASCRR